MYYEHPYRNDGLHLALADSLPVHAIQVRGGVRANVPGHGCFMFLPLPVRHHGRAVRAAVRRRGDREIDKLGKAVCAVGVLELSQCEAFDLAHALPRHGKYPADFRQGIGIAVVKTVAEPDDLSFAVVQRGKRSIDS